MLNICAHVRVHVAQANHLILHAHNAVQIGHPRIVNLDLCTAARAPNAYVRFDHLPCQPLGWTSDHRDRDDLVFGESETPKTIAGISSAFGSSRRTVWMPLTHTKLGCVNPNQLPSLRLINGLQVPQILLRSIGHVLGLHVHSSFSSAQENHFVFTFVPSCPLERLRCHLRYDFAVIAVSEIALPLGSWNFTEPTRPEWT